MIRNLDRDPDTKIDGWPFYSNGSLVFNYVSRDVFILHVIDENEKSWKKIGRIPEGIEVYNGDCISLNSQECSVCGICEESRKINIHHIDRNRKNNKSENLISLCVSCHNTCHRFIKEGLPNVESLELTKRLGRIYQDECSSYFHENISKDEKMDNEIRETFLSNGIDLPPKYIGFHNTKKCRIYCEVGEYDFDCVKKFCKIHKLKMKDFVYASIFYEIKRIEGVDQEG